MTQEQIKLLKDSWGYVLANRNNVGELFYTKLFKKAPGVRSLFPEDLSDQVKKLVSSITFVVQNLGDLTIVKLRIKELGERHQAYGAVEAHYPIVSQNLIETLKEAMGEKRFNDETEEAWNIALKFISDEMLRAYTE